MVYLAFIVPALQLLLGAMLVSDPRQRRFLLFSRTKDFGQKSEEQIDDLVKGWGMLIVVIGTLAAAALCFAIFVSP